MRGEYSMKPLIIGIAGGSASGKTSISRHIQEKFSDLTRVLVIRQDDYYKDQSHKPMSERIKTNYDHPSAFDNDLLVSQVHDLMDGKPIEKPTYDFVNHTRSDVSECCYPCDVLIHNTFHCSATFLYISIQSSNKTNICIRINKHFDIQ